MSLLVFVAVEATAAAQNCVKKTNVEAIVDDSGSMSGTDPNRLRVDAVELFVNTPGNERKVLGALEFGSSSSPLFGPGPIGPFRGPMVQIAQQRLTADNGGTDYDDAFKGAAAHNPNANARIFLTDGAHNGTYGESHRGGPPTYVLGLTSGIAPADEGRLQQIATETGGLYQRAPTSNELVAAMNNLQTAIDCAAAPVNWTDVFTRIGQIRRHTLTIPGGIRVVQFVLSWSNLADYFDIINLRLVQNGRVVGRADASARRRKRRVRKLRVTKRRGRTFVSVRVRGLRKGRLRFQLKARRLSQPGVPTRLTTQGSRRRR